MYQGSKENLSYRVPSITGGGTRRQSMCKQDRKVTRGLFLFPSRTRTPPLTTKCSHTRKDFLGQWASYQYISSTSNVRPSRQGNRLNSTGPRNPRGPTRYFHPREVTPLLMQRAHYVKVLFLPFPTNRNPSQSSLIIRVMSSDYLFPLQEQAIHANYFANFYFKA